MTARAIVQYVPCQCGESARCVLIHSSLTAPTSGRRLGRLRGRINHTAAPPTTPAISVKTTQPTDIPPRNSSELEPNDARGTPPRRPKWSQSIYNDWTYPHSRGARHEAYGAVGQPVGVRRTCRGVARCAAAGRAACGVCWRRHVLEGHRADPAAELSELP